VDTLGHQRSVVLTPANEQARAQVGERCRQVQQVADGELQGLPKPEGQTGFVSVVIAPPLGGRTPLCLVQPLHFVVFSCMMLAKYVNSANRLYGQLLLTIVFREDRQIYFEALEQNRVAEDLAVFMDFMRGQHGKSLTYQLSASVPRT
jgi:hypothetical protein